MLSANYPVFMTGSVPLQTRSLRLEIFEDEPAVGEAAAQFVAGQIVQNPANVLLLPTGRTPLLMYAALLKQVQNGQLDLSRVKTFNLDEFYGIEATHPGSYHRYMWQNFFDRAAIPPENIDLLDGSAPDLVKECAAYESKIRAAGGADLAILGLGANGHIGFNEPGSTFDSRTRLVSIQPGTREANAFLFNNRLEEVPQRALTVGIGTIMEARRILLLVTGRPKASALAGMLNGPLTTGLPASCLRLHPEVILLSDREAASEILE
jgi:glucosamine-6-phosphate deaminase